MTKNAKEKLYNQNTKINTAVIFVRYGARTSTVKVRLSALSVAEAVLQYFILAAVGFFCTRGRVIGNIFPVALSLIGGLPFPATIIAAAGSVVGYFIPIDESSAFRYIIASVGIAAIKALCHGTFKSSERAFFSALITALVTLSTGIVTIKSELFSFPLLAVETVIALSGAYFINRGIKAVKKETVGLKSEELSSAVIGLALVFTGLFGAGIGEVSIGRIAAVIFIMTAARFGGIPSGTICGVALSISALISGNSSGVMLVFAFGGMMCGVFSYLGKYAMAVSFFIAAVIGLALTMDTNIYLFLAEAFVGVVAFLLLPKNIGVKVGKMLAPTPMIEAPTGLKKSIVMRLCFASNALNDVSSTVEQVAKELSKINSPDFSDVLKGIEGEACRGCSLRTHCWELKRNDTVSAVIDITRAVKTGENQLTGFAPEEFRGRCLRLNNFTSAAELHYKDYASKIAAENRLEEVRSVVSDQFDGISIMLNDLATEIDSGEVFDNAAAEAIAASLKSIDVLVDGCCCKFDKYGRLGVEIRIKNQRSGTINRMQIKRQVSLCTNRDFEPPTVTAFGEDTLLSLSERARLKADIGVSQIASSKHTMCGDAYKYFPDGKGRSVLVLSDGMGAGGRAAVDGAMASGLISRLLLAGFGYDCSLKILNSSMLFKSTDESMATVDVAVIDLFTGKTDLLKAGAAATLVRRNGRTGKAQSNSFPVGILRDVSFDKATVRLKVGDILLLLSDGALCDGTDWICAELEKWGEGSAQELSEKICEGAKRRSDSPHSDDITVMAAIIHKNNE